jgi:hypothetical protein
MYPIMEPMLTGRTIEIVGEVRRDGGRERAMRRAGVAMLFGG